jgi:hypothetical protein
MASSVISLPSDAELAKKNRTADGGASDLHTFAAPHVAGAEIGDQAIRRGLEKGEIPPEFREMCRLVDVGDPLSKQFQDVVTEVTKAVMATESWQKSQKLLKRDDRTVTFSGVRAVVSEVAGENAFYARGSEPVLIGIHKELLRKASPEMLIICITHELTHALWRAKLPTHGNSKVQESSCYALPLAVLHDLGIDPTPHKKVFMDWLKSQTSQTGVTTLAGIIDVHPVPATVESVLDTMLAQLTKDRGILAETAQSEESSRILSLCRSFQQNVPTEPQYHSPLEMFKQGVFGYDSLSAEEKLRELSTYIRELDLPYPVRIKELREELRSLKGQIDPANQANIALLDDCADLLLARITESPQRWGEVYYSLAQTVKVKGIVPLGRLKLLDSGIIAIVEACKTSTGLHDACADFLAVTENEPLAHSDEGREFLRSITWKTFAWPDKYEREDKTPVQWQPLVDLARDDLEQNRDSTALDVAIMLGLAEDHRILKRIPQSPRYFTYLCEDAGHWPRRAANPMEGAALCGPPSDDVRGERLMQLRFKKAKERASYPRFNQSTESYEQDIKEVLRVVRGTLLEKITENPRNCFSDLGNFVRLGVLEQGLSTDQERNQRAFEFDRDIFTIVPDQFLQVYCSDLGVPEGAKKFEEWFRSEFPRVFASHGPFSEQDAEEVRRILGVYRGEETPFKRGLMLLLNLFPPEPSSLESVPFNPPPLYRELLKNPGLLSSGERTFLVGTLFQQWNFKGGPRLGVFHPDPRASAEWLKLINTSEAFSAFTALQHHGTWQEFLRVSDEDLRGAAAELVKLGVPHAQARGCVESVRDLNWLALAENHPDSLPDIAAALKHFERHIMNKIIPEVVKPFVEKLRTDLPQFLKGAAIHDLLAVAETVGSITEFSPLERQERILFHTELSKRLKGEGLQMRERISVAAFGLGGVEDPVLRAGFVDAWVSSVVEQLAGSSADAARVLPFVRNLRDKGSSAVLSLTLNTLAERIAAGPVLCRELAALQSSLENISHSKVWMGGILTEGTLEALRSDDGTREAAYDYLRHPRSEQWAQALLWTLLEREDEFELARDLLGEWGDDLLGEWGGDLKKMFDELKACNQDARKLPKRHRELLRACTKRLLLLHDNFQAAPLEAQAVILSELLIGDRSDGLPVELMDKAIDDAFAGTAPHAATTRAWVKALIRNLEPFEQPLYVAALVATHSQGKVKSDLAESIVEIADMLSALAKKGVQCAAGDPRTSPEFRKPFRSVTHQVREVPRWEYVKWLQEIEPELLRSFAEFEARQGRSVPEDLSIASIGRRLGSGSVSANVEVTLSDDTKLSVSLIRPYTIERTHRDQVLFGGAIDTMLARGEAPTTVNFYRSLLDAAAKRMELEVNGDITDTQGALLERAEDGRVVVIGEKRVPIHSAKVRAQGECFYACDVAPGTVLTELLIADDQARMSNRAAQKRRADLYDYSVAIVVNELTNILDGCFCPDRQPGNILIDSSGVHHIDPKGIQVAQWNKEGYEQLIDVLLGATLSALKDQSSSSLPESQADRFMESFIDQIDSLGKNGKELEPLVTEVQKALTALLPLFSRLEPNDLPRVLASALVNQQGEAFRSALVSIARRELNDPQTELGMELNKKIQGTSYGSFAKTFMQFLPDSAVLSNLQDKLQEWLREKAQFEVIRIER